MIDERELREMLQRRAGAISATPTDAPVAVRRARRRLALNAVVGTLVGLAVLAGAFAGIRTIQAAPTPADPPTPAPPPASLGSLAYVLDGDVYVADPDGSNAVKIADGRSIEDCGDGRGEFWGEGSMWSPDGRYLAYRHTDCSDPESGGVVISDAEGNLVATFPTGKGWDIGWSPDSTRVAVWDTLFEKVGVYGVDGVRQAQITMPSGWEAVGDNDPAWLPDGTLAIDKVLLPLDGSEARSLDAARAAEWRGDYLATIGLRVDSPDGSLTAYTGRRSLMVEDSDGSPSSRVRLLRVDPGTFLWINGFSPQGDRILFSKDRQGRRSLWSIGVDGSGARLVAAGAIQGDWFSPSQIG